MKRMARRNPVAAGGTVLLLAALAACSSSSAAPVGPNEEVVTAPTAEATATPTAGAAENPGVTPGQYPAMRAVHMTGISWLTPSLKDPVIQALKDKRIDAIQLDIKDEEGVVSFDSNTEPANLSGADKVNTTYDAAAAVKEIHDLGGTVIGRIVAFRDPQVGSWAAQNGKMDWVIQDKSGNPYKTGSYGKGAFTNFANPEIRKYNIDLALEAARAGFDSIMYDYIRRPEAHAASGGLAAQVFPGIGSTDPQDAIVSFLAEAQPQIHAAGAQVGAAVFGVSAFTPISVGQNIPKMAKHLDYINPMVYPSHWGPGEYSVASPNSMPYEIVNRSMLDFNRQVLGTNCVIIPWLQAFPWAGVSYGEANIRKQIQATKDTGVNSWILWNASVKYTWSALDPKDKSSSYPGETVYSINKPGNRSDGTKDAAKAKEFIDAYNAWVAGGRQGLFVAPGQAPAGGTAAPTSTPTTAATPAPTATGTPTAAITTP
ncbi:MAG: putative glycoside hydrolase [Sporichthyaceae bacterium]